MNTRARPSPASAAAAAPLDPDLLRSGSILIYCRASVTLSLLVYASILVLLYSDFYVHLVRQARGALDPSRALPGGLFAVLAVGCAALARVMKPRLEKAALLMLALNIGLLLFRGRADTNSDLHLLLCAVSFLLDLGLLAAVVAFYRKYPNALKRLREE